jgi:hypothetical protein
MGMNNFYHRVARRFFAANTRREYLRFSLRIFAAFSAFLFFSQMTVAQQSNLPLNYEWMQETEGQIVKNGGFPLNYTKPFYRADPSDTLAVIAILNVRPVHSSMRPMIENRSPLQKNLILNNDARLFQPKAKESISGFPFWIRNYHRHNSLLQVERPAANGEPFFNLYIDPLLNLQYMNVSGDTTEPSFYINTRGVRAHGDIGHNVSFETSFWENQAFFPKYLADYSRAMLIVPGQGRWKTFKQTGFDFASANGYVSWAVCSYFNLQMGHGKFFVGDGYRSLLLSDNSMNYPYARFTGWIGKKKTVQYTSIYASLMNLRSISPIPVGTERLYQKKAASFHQISALIGDFGEISFFQGLIWNAADSTNRQCLRLAYFNPVIFTAPLGQGLSGRNNFLLGMTFRFDFLRAIRLYGQLMADDIGKKTTVHAKTGMQLGLKYFDAFTLKHLHLQFEMNRVRPYSYAATDPTQSYTHYNQPLAHPLGANFTEMSFYIHYKVGDFFLQARYSTAKLGADSAGYQNFGQDVFKTDYAAYYPATGTTYTIGQGQSHSINYLDLRIGYMISYASNLNIALGYVNRNMQTGATSTPTSYVYVALRTSLTNTYYDLFRK